MATQRVRRTVGVVVVMAMAGSGCFASSDQHAALERRVASIEHAEQDRRHQLEEADQQVHALNAQLEQARTQTRNLADLGARLDGIDEQLRTLHGAVDEIHRSMETGAHDDSEQRQELANRLAALERRLLETERRTGLAPAVDPNQIPAAAADVITQARQALVAHDANRARALANALLQRTPQDPLADDARLLIARSYVTENRNATAVQEFQRLLTDYPAGDAVPDALSELAEALVHLGLCQPAQRTLHILIDRHGQTPQGQAARRRVEEVRHLPRAACTG